MRLPSIRDLARLFDCSPNTVRRALEPHLRSGDIVGRRRKGIFVRQMPAQLPAAVPAQGAWERMAGAIENDIRSGLLRRGDTLPAVKIACGIHKVSATTAMRAYRILIQKNFVCRQGRYYCVETAAGEQVQRQKAPIYVFSTGPDRLFENPPWAEAFRAMEEELMCCYRAALRFERPETIDEHFREWEKNKRYPVGIIIQAREQIDRQKLIPHLRALNAVPDHARPGVVMLFNVSGRIPKAVCFLGHGTTHTSRARSLAQFAVRKEFKSIRYILDENNNKNNDFLIHARLWGEVRRIAPEMNIGFHILPSIMPRNTEDFLQRVAERAGYNWRITLRVTLSDLADKRLDDLLRDIHFHSSLSDAVVNPAYPALFLFPDDNTAATVKRLCANMGVEIPKTVSLVSYENGSLAALHAITSVSIDLSRIGYLVAHALIRDFQVNRSAKGFIRIPARVIERNTTP